MKGLEDIVGADWISWGNYESDFHFFPQKSICDVEGHLHSDFQWGSKPSPYDPGYMYRECSRCEEGYEEITLPQVTSIKLSATKYTYDGKVKTPTVTVKDSAGTKLILDTDYTIEYESGRKNAGTVCRKKREYKRKTEG